jgi:hypothetical protein
MVASVDCVKWPAAALEPADEFHGKTIEEGNGKQLGREKSAASWKDPGPPPDGGLRAWTQVLVGHLVIMNTW